MIQYARNKKAARGDALFSIFGVRATSEKDRTKKKCKLYIFEQKQK